MPVTLPGQMYRYYLHQEGTCLGTHVTDINLSNGVKAWLCMANSHVPRLVSTVASIPTTTQRLQNVPGWCLVSYVYIQPIAHYKLTSSRLHTRNWLVVVHKFYTLL